MKRLQKVILGSLLLGACAPHQISQSQNPEKVAFEIGVNIHLDRYPKIARASEMGASWVRMDVNWDGIEREPGHWDFSATDSSIEDARKQGLKVYATLVYAPAWASREGRNISVPDPLAWKNFVATVARRYCGKVDVYGIWNEPNLEEFWAGSAEQYVHVLLKPAWEAIHNEAPGARVAGPDLAHIYGARLGIQSFFDTLQREGAGQYLDILTHHIYGEDDFGQKVSGFGFAGLIYKPGLLQMLKHSGLDSKEVWITEMGADAKALGEDAQASVVAMQIRVLRQQPWIKKAFIYQLGDDDDEGPNWGLMRSNQTLRQVFKEVKALTR